MKQLPLSQGLFATVDDEDWDRVSTYKWSAHPGRRTWYAVRNQKGQSVLLHRFILAAGKGTEVDHTDHDGLNCTRSNLRFVTRSQNQQNRTGAARNSQTGIRGVWMHRPTARYMATARINGRRHYFGYFKDLHAAEEAAIAGRARLMTHSAECNAKARESA